MASIESGIVIEIDERTPANNMQEPYAVVFNDRRLVFGSRRASFNPSGFNEYSGFIEKYKCTCLNMDYNGIGYKTKELDQKFGSVKGIHRIEVLHLTGSFVVPSHFEGLDALRGIKVLLTDTGSFSGKIAGRFPELEIWMNFNWSANPIKGDADLPKLRSLSIAGMKGDFSPFERCDLRKLLFSCPSLKSLESVAKFKNLEVLQVGSPRALLDVSVLGSLPKLRCLDFGSKKLHPGWLDFKSKSLRVLRASVVDSVKVLDNFPNLEKYDLAKVVNDKNRRHINFDISEFDDPFTSVLETK